MRTRLLPLLLTLAIAAPLAAATRRRSVTPDHCVATVSPASVSIPAEGGLGSFNRRQTNVDSPAGSWVDATILFFTDSRTQSFLLVIGVGGTTTPPFSAWFDDVYVRPKP